MHDFTPLHNEPSDMQITVHTDASNFTHSGPIMSFGSFMASLDPKRTFLYIGLIAISSIFKKL